MLRNAPSTNAAPTPSVAAPAIEPAQYRGGPPPGRANRLPPRAYRGPAARSPRYAGRPVAPRGYRGPAVRSPRYAGRPVPPRGYRGPVRGPRHVVRRPIPGNAYRRPLPPRYVGRPIRPLPPRYVGRPVPPPYWGPRPIYRPPVRAWVPPVRVWPRPWYAYPATYVAPLAPCGTRIVRVRRNGVIVSQRVRCAPYIYGPTFFGGLYVPF